MVFKRIGQALARKRKREREIILEDLFFFPLSINIKVYPVDFKDYSLKGKLLAIIEHACMIYTYGVSLIFLLS